MFQFKADANSPHNDEIMGKKYIVHCKRDDTNHPIILDADISWFISLQNCETIELGYLHESSDPS